ncbi:MAG TPA: antitoxin family protein [Planctomycetaceae bacterium]|nr:antitoxin family protein [Planctomycetaceae bacterium]
MTSKTLEAVVEGDVLRPLQKLGLPDRQHVLVTIVALKQQAHDRAGSCYDLARDLGVIGVADDTPPDLSSNPAHMEGFGTR